MKVVLKQDVKKVGLRGEVIDVPMGFAVNYLLPEGLALMATKEAVQQANMRKKERQKQEHKQAEVLKNLSKNVHKKKFRIKVEASKSGRLYGSLDQAAVEKELANQWGLSGGAVSIRVDLAQPIRDTGTYPLDVVVSGAGGDQAVEILLAVVGQ